MFKKKVKLPTSSYEFDELVAKVVKKFKIEDAHHAAAMISMAIRHLPSTQAYSTLDYFGHYVYKSIANFVANHKSQILQHEAQVDQLVSILKNDPNDNQALDELQKAANEGSKYAAGFLDQFLNKVETANSQITN